MSILNNFKIFKKKDRKDEKQLVSDIMGIEVYRLVNGTPVEIAKFDANIIKDKNNNSVIINEDYLFKEDLPGVQETLVSDILYKLENRNYTKERQIEEVKKAISKQEDLIKSIKNGYIIRETKNDEGEIVQHKIKVNIRTEESKLRLFKCIEFTLNNKKGDGYFESISINGKRTLKYLLLNGELIPYFHRTPTSAGEPIVLVPDMVQRKKFYKEKQDEILNDFYESNDHRWKGLFATITKALVVILILGNIFWASQNMKWQKEINNEDISDEINKLKLQNEQIRKECSEYLQKQADYLNNQVDTNTELIDYAKLKILEEQSKINVQDKNNIKI